MVGPGVTVVRPGDRVAYAGGPRWSYAGARVLPADRLIPIPDDVMDQTAAVALKGMTAQYLIRRTYPVKARESVLFHAAAGRIGVIACQWLKALGAAVIGTIGSDEKAAVARALADMIPHLVDGISGHRFQSPSASAPGGAYRRR